MSRRRLRYRRHTAIGASPAATVEMDGRTAMTTRRDALGQQIRRATPLVEKLVRRLNKETPARLADFGVKPR